MLKAKTHAKLSALETFAGGLFSNFPITPNQWTSLSMVFGLLGFLSLAIFRSLHAASVLFLLAFLLDYVDGAVARYSKSETKMGAYIDGVSDRFVEAFMIFGLMFYRIPSVIIDANISLALLLFFSVMTSYVRAYAGHKGIVTNERDFGKMGGLLERFERVFILLSSIVISFIYGTELISYSVAVLILLSAVTVGQRILFVLQRPGK